MFGCIKGAVKFGALVVLVGGATAIVLGPARMGAMAQTVRESIRDSIDRSISDTTALKTKLQRLESQYPRQIAQTERDLADVRRQIGQVRHEIAVSEGVVALVDRDLETFEQLLTKADEQRRSGSFGVLRVRVGETTMTTSEAQLKATQLTKLRDSHRANASQLLGHLNKLESQELRLDEHLSLLASEHAELRGQIAMIERQIEAYERNERLLSNMEQRENRLATFDRYDAAGLEDFRRHMLSLEADQQRRFEAIGGDALSRDYEDRARLRADLDHDRVISIPGGEETSGEPTPLALGRGS